MFQVDYSGILTMKV